ncbi:MAG: hypothetical protein K2P81_08290 [Bacteriovoracaceae bacterium]|nr:hypothetical protein [Bacteriovoracaceae bacterium]
MERGIFSMASSGNPSQTRFAILRKLLAEGLASTQDEIREALEAAGHEVTQSTVSRDLRKLEAVKAIDSKGRTIYRLAEDSGAVITANGSLLDMILSVVHNETMIVMHTTPGSASLVARHLDHVRPGGILGTIAGDDTIFIAPPKSSTIKKTIQDITESFH